MNNTKENQRTIDRLKSISMKEFLASVKMKSPKKRSDLLKKYKNSSILEYVMDLKKELVKFNGRKVPWVLYKSAGKSDYFSEFRFLLSTKYGLSPKAIKYLWDELDQKTLEFKNANNHKQFEKLQSPHDQDGTSVIYGVGIAIGVGLLIALKLILKGKPGGPKFPPIP